MNSQFKVCIVGCGVISGNHIPSLQMLKSVNIAALCDVDQNKAEARRQQFSLDCPIYTDYIKMLDEIKPDAIHILTPHHLHTEMTLAALDRDINVFLEKPMCIKEEDIAKLISKESESKGRVCVSFQTRYSETTRRAKELVDADGGATGGFGTISWNRSDEYYAADAWRGKWATEGGGALINQAIHTIDLLCFFLGIPKKVQASISKIRHSDNVEVEDSCVGIIDHETGLRSNILVTTTFSGKDSTTLHLETKNHVIEIRNARIYIDDERVDTKEITSYMGKECYGNSHVTIIERFYKALGEGAPMPVSLEDAKHALLVVLAAYRSNSEMVNV